MTNSWNSHALEFFFQKKNPFSPRIYWKSWWLHFECLFVLTLIRGIFLLPCIFLFFRMAYEFIRLLGEWVKLKSCWNIIVQSVFYLLLFSFRFFAWFLFFVFRLAFGFSWECKCKAFFSCFSDTINPFFYCVS